MADLNLQKKSRSNVIPIVLVVAAVLLIVWMFSRNDRARAGNDGVTSAPSQAQSVNARSQPLRTLIEDIGFAHHALTA